MNISKKDIDLSNNSVQLKDFKNKGTYYGFFNDKIKSYLSEITKTLKINEKIIKSNIDKIRYRIGKLTPLECERLQTLPDNYTE